MCFWQWLIANKEIIMIFANIASVIVMVFVGIALFMSAKEFKLNKETSQAGMFHNITKEINSFLKEELQHIYKDGNEKESYENWLDRLLGLFEYYAYFANRKSFSKDMSEFYLVDIEHYCEKTKEYPELIKEIKSLEEKKVYCEIRNYYRNYIGKICPF